MLSPLDLLESFLNTPSRVIFTFRDTFTGTCTPFFKTSSHRYIRILRGQLVYQVDQTSYRLEAGTIFFVARGSLREWGVPPGEMCEIIWCEFDSPGVSPDPHTIYFAEDKNKLEKAALMRICNLWTFPRHLRGGPHGDPSLPRQIALQLEGELKASLARFWTSAVSGLSPSEPQTEGEERVPPAVRQALVWMEENYCKPDAQKRLYEKVLDLSPNHFRLLFAKYTGGTVSSHLFKLRMREAMNLLRNTSLSIKEVAAAVGFNHPLYFTKRFHEHWDIPPTGVRK